MRTVSDRFRIEAHDRERWASDTCDFCACTLCANVADCPVHEADRPHPDAMRDRMPNTQLRPNRCNVVCAKLCAERPSQSPAAKAAAKDPLEVPLRFTGILPSDHRDESESLERCRAVCPRFEPDQAERFEPVVGSALGNVNHPTPERVSVAAIHAAPSGLPKRKGRKK